MAGVLRLRKQAGERAQGEQPRGGGGWGWWGRCVGRREGRVRHQQQPKKRDKLKEKNREDRERNESLRGGGGVNVKVN